MVEKGIVQTIIAAAVSGGVAPIIKFVVTAGGIQIDVRSWFVHLLLFLRKE